MQRLVMRQSKSKTVSPFWGLFVLPVLRRRRLIYYVVGVSLLLTLVYCMVTPNQYTSTSTILPSGKPDQLAQLGQLAAGTLADVGLGSVIQAQENSSALYPKILTSRLISENVLRRNYEVGSGDKAKSMTLLEYIGSRNLDVALRKLANRVNIGFDRTTGFITLSVTTEYPKLSAAVAHAYLDELNNYNVNYRQSKARDNERFVAARLDEVKRELQAAEDSLRMLQQQNLNYMSAIDPGLRADLNRLERDVKVKEAVFLSLSEKYELARLEAVKDVPVVQVLDRGSAPTVKTSPRRSIYLFGAFIGSLFAGVVLCLWFDVSAKRSLRSQLKNAVIDSGAPMNRVETAVLRHAGRLADLIERPSRAEIERTTINDSQ